MITFPQPINIAPTVATFSTLPFVIEDNAAAKWVRVRFPGIPKPLPIWSGDAYTAAGDYTQAQIESAVVAVLGSNPASVLAGLYPSIPVTNKTVSVS